MSEKPLDSSTDRNLLLGILALQLDFIDRDQLVSAMNAWVSAKSEPLEQHLYRQGVLDSDSRELLVALVQKHLDLHGDDPQKSLAALSSLQEEIRVDLKSLADPVIDLTLTLVSSDRQLDLDSPGAVRSRSGLRGGESAKTDDGLRFRILRPHAKGGLGQVSLALDSELNREVALKEIQSKHADHAESRIRFVQEAEVTGGLEHPGIVPVYGLGHYQDGRPYYAMRFVRGDSLKQAIEEFHKTQRDTTSSSYRLQLRNLLGRFIDVCNAVEYAHSRGVLHRDLKPGNIMLGRYGETLVVDWGLAKLMGKADSVTSEPFLQPVSGSGNTPTQMGSAIGTPAFMSPEQAAGELDKIGPATDVYSLGATLYNILTARTPCEGSDPVSVMNNVREGRITPPRQLNPGLPQPLEAICLKALARVPADRFGTPQELANEIENWLADETVRCYREPWTAAARRWMRRHPVFVSSGTVALVVGCFALAVAATVVANKNAVILNVNNQLKTRNSELQSARDLAAERQVEADRQKTRALAINEFLVRALRSPDPDLDGREVKVKDLLDQALLALSNDFQGDDVTHAALLDAIGHTYLGLGLNAQAVPVLNQAVELSAAIPGGSPASETERFVYLYHLAAARLGAGDVPEAVSLCEQALTGLEQRLPEDDEQRLVAEALRGHLFLQTTENEKALALLDRTYRRMRDVLGEESESTLSCLVELALCHKRLGDQASSLSLLQPAIPQLHRSLGEAHSKTLAAENNLARLLADMSRLDEAEAVYRQLLTKMETKLGQDHPLTMRAMDNLAALLRKQSRWDEAKDLYEETLRLRTKNLGENHLDTLITVDGLASTLQEIGALDQAVPLFERSLALTRQRLGDENHETLAAMLNLALAYQDQGRLEDAEKLLLETRALQEKVFDRNHPSVLVLKNNLANLYQDRGRLAEAIDMHQQVLEIRQRTLGDTHVDTMSSMNNLGYALAEAERYDQALEILMKTLALRKEHLPSPHIQVANTLGNIGLVYRMRGELANSIPYFEEAHDIVRQVHGDSHPNTNVARFNFAGSLVEDESRWDEAIGHMTELKDIYEEQDVRWVAAMLSIRIGDVERRQGKMEAAEEKLQTVVQSLRSGEVLLPETQKEKIEGELRAALVELYLDWDQPDKAEAARAIENFSTSE